MNPSSQHSITGRVGDLPQLGQVLLGALARLGAPRCLIDRLECERPTHALWLPQVECQEEAARLEVSATNVVDERQPHRDRFVDVEAKQITWRDLARIVTSPAQAAQP